MPIKAQITREAVDSSEEIKVHFIPASIDGNGAIKIDEYFNSYMESDANGRKSLNIDKMIIISISNMTGIIVVETNTLRGFPLKGTAVKLPNNFQGIVLREEEKLQIESSERDLKFGGKFSEFTYWNYDKNPSENDAYRKALHWMKVAEAVSQIS